MTYRKPDLLAALALPCLLATAAAPLGAQPPSTPSSSPPPAAAAPSSSSPPPTATSATSPSSSTPSSSTPSSSAASASTTATTTAPSAPEGPSPELIKKARAEGFKPEVQKNGETMFCYKDASIGTHFETKKCIHADELQAVIDQRIDQRNGLNSLRTCAGAGCGAH